MLRIAIRLVTITALLGALAIAVYWWIDPSQDWLQAPGTTLALIAAVAGIPADRWAAQAQGRARAIDALLRELEQNRQVLTDSRFQPENQGLGQIYPRLMLGAVDTAFISGALNAKRDRDLTQLILDWRNAAEDLNRRLEITELRLCIVDQLDREELLPLRELVSRPDGYFAYTARLLNELVDALNDAAEGPRWLPGFLRDETDIASRLP